MRIAQLILPDASSFERKSQRIDAEELRRRHEVQTVHLPAERLLKDLADADVVHVYGGIVPLQIARAVGRAYVASGPLASARFSFRGRPREPRRISPIGSAAVPEAVSTEFFESPPRGTEEPRNRGTSFEIGVFAGARPDIPRMIDLTRVRLARFRDDVGWSVFHAPPTPAELRSIDLWLDPAIDDSDFDGMTAEALVADLPVVATRTPINIERLNSGTNGLLVPIGDANEMTHAILAALFKPEVREPRRQSARLTRDRFRPERRTMALLGIYETLHR